MSFKLKYMIFGKIAIILCLCLVLNNTFVIKSYASESIATQNPLFIPISTLVTTVAVGSGIIAKNSSEAIQAGNELVNNVINNIKNTEIARKNADSNYVSPYKVINGQGQPEEPNDNNKNGKWVGLAGGTIASGEIWANREAVKDIMSEINNYKGYEKTYVLSGVKNISDTNFLSTTDASGIALQLANISNSAVKQFDDFIHSDWFSKKGISPDDCLFSVGVSVENILREQPIYPYLTVNMTIKPNNLNKLRLVSNIFDSYTYSNQYGSLSYYYSNTTSVGCQLLDENNVSISTRFYRALVYSRTNTNEALTINTLENGSTTYYQTNTGGENGKAFCGYKWILENPWQLTNNVYNVNQTFDVNFPDWLQSSINLLNQNIDAVRLGILNLNDPWNNTQNQVQSGLSPTTVINQYINNYNNPDNIPDDEEEPDNPVVPPVIQEPQPTNDYLGNFLLPESITTKFPFCIPFDVARCLRLFSVSSREAPKWECDLNYGSSTYHVVIDLSMFNDVANFIRPLEYILFLVGLALGTRSLIRG